MKANLFIPLPVASLLGFIGTSLFVMAQENAIQLTLKGGWASASEPVRKVQVIGPYAYLVVGETGLQVLDISSPTNPVALGRYAASQRINGFHVAGHLACLATGDSITQTNDPGILEVVDVSQPTNVLLLSGTTTSGRANNVYLTDDFAYVAEGTSWTGSNLVGALEIFCITNPANPSLVEHYETSAAVHDVQVVGNYAYLAGGNADLTVLEVSRPQEPVPIGSFETNAMRKIGSIGVWGDNACLVFNSILYVLNVSDPTLPALIYTWGGIRRGALYGVSAVHLSERYFYYMWWQNGSFGEPPRCGLKITDISDPDRWIGLGSSSVTVCAWDLRVAGNHLYVALGQAGLWIYEITELPYFRSIARSGEGVVLSWNDLPGLKLQSTPSLAIPNWLDVPGSVGTNQMQLPLGDAHQFFRLIQLQPVR